MNRRIFIFGILSALGANRAAGAPSPIGGLLESGQRLLEDQVDPRLLQALESAQAGRAEGLLQQAVQLFGGDYVLDLAALEDGVTSLLPLLEASAETRPYAAWLRARADYFRVADWFRDTIPRPSVPTGQPPPPPANPTPEMERKAWNRELERRPAPKGAAVWVPRLKPVFRSAGAPLELVWLAELESAFDPEARSPVGAVGLYQLMPKTATGLGLKLAPRDERLVPEKNAGAAGRYLRQLHRQFGDWPLALAAYNAGPGRVAETLRQRRARSYDAIAPSLPAETQMYVPKFEAVLRRREGLALGKLRAPAAA